MSRSLDDGSDNHPSTSQEDDPSPAELVAKQSRTKTADQAAGIIQRDNGPNVSWGRVSHSFQESRLRDEATEDALTLC